MRLGWDDDRAQRAGSLARRAEEAGVQMVTVHGRTRCQFYTGQGRLARDRRASRQPCPIPVVANGDVGPADDAAEILRASGADAVMVGRASYGAPWHAGRDRRARAAGSAAASAGARSGRLCRRSLRGHARRSTASRAACARRASISAGISTRHAPTCRRADARRHHDIDRARPWSSQRSAHAFARARSDAGHGSPA